jgi:cytochrome b involved in lipid metabolism
MLALMEADPQTTLTGRRNAKRSISWEEVAKHRHYDDCWVIFDGKVLALPANFLDEHPGGSDAVFAFAGRDCTEAYYELGHSISATQWAVHFAIGNLANHQCDVDRPGKRKCRLKKQEPNKRLIGGFGALHSFSETCMDVLESQLYSHSEEAFVAQYAAVFAAIVSAASAGVLAWKFAGLARQS